MDFLRSSSVIPSARSISGRSSLQKMPRFFSGDELGNIKALNYLPAESKVTVETLYDGSGKGKHRAVQKMAVSTDGQLVHV
jgi:hypothetical protein